MTAIKAQRTILAALVAALCGLGMSACCEPDCDQRECGGDGCGGTCGGCSGMRSVCSAGMCICHRDCQLRDCGDDGCGGSCGLCTGGFECRDGVCECRPQCSGRQCGDDGCRGSCGACPPDQVCIGSQCCKPNCEGRECGPDGCGGSCGACGGGYACAAGLCSCIASCEGAECGDDGCGGSCGECEPGQACVAGQCECEPFCEGRECGLDGCGSTCGICSPYETCLEEPVPPYRSVCTLTDAACPPPPWTPPPGLCEQDSDCSVGGDCVDICGWRTCLCDHDQDCVAGSSVCALIEAAAGLKACVPLCDEEPPPPCPPGLTCVPLWAEDGGEQHACSLDVHFVCQPCQEDQDCHAAGDGCELLLLAGMDYCFEPCAVDLTCPEQFECAPKDGDLFCVPETGLCP